jgi:hypothetical protein
MQLRLEYSRARLGIGRNLEKDLLLFDKYYVTRERHGLTINVDACRFAGLNWVANYLAVVDRFSPDGEKFVQCEISNGVGFYVNGA